MRLKIHESTIKIMSKLRQGERLQAIDALGNRLFAVKRGPHVVIDVTLGVDR